MTIHIQGRQLTLQEVQKYIGNYIRTSDGQPAILVEVLNAGPDTKPGDLKALYVDHHMLADVDHGATEIMNRIMPAFSQIFGKAIPTPGARMKIRKTDKPLMPHVKPWHVCMDYFDEPIFTTETFQEAIQKASKLAASIKQSHRLAQGQEKGN